MPIAAASLPKTYTASLGWKIFLAALGFPLGIGGLAGVWYFGTGHEVTDDVQAYLMIGICVSIAALGFACAIIPLLSRFLVLQEDALVVPGIFRDTVIRRDRISGYRIFSNQGMKVLQLHVAGADGARKKTHVTMLFRPDEALARWFRNVPDLDAAELSAARREVRSDERLGMTPQERIGNVTWAKKIGRILTGACFVLGAWAMFDPRPYQLLFMILASLPLLVLWLCGQYQGWFSIDDTGKHTARADLTAVLMMPGFFLAPRAFSDVRMLDASQLVVPGLVALAVLVAGIAWLAPFYRRSIGKLVLLAAVMSPYPASTIAIANMVFDRGPSEHHIVPVLGKQATTGKGASQFFSIARWDAAGGQRELEVTRELYQRTERGQMVCVSVHSGVLGLGWYSAGPAAACRH